MGGKGGAAHAHNAGLPDDAGERFGAEALETGAGLHLRGEGFLKVVGDDHGEHRGAIGVRPGLHRLDGAGDRSVDRRAQAGAVADFLPQIHMISLGDQGLAGGADVLGHGNHHGGRGREGHNGLLPGQGLLVLGVDAAVKGKCHEYHHLF